MSDIWDNTFNDIFNVNFYYYSVERLEYLKLIFLNIYSNKCHVPMICYTGSYVDPSP